MEQTYLSTLQHAMEQMYLSTLQHPKPSIFHVRAFNDFCVHAQIRRK